MYIIMFDIIDTGFFVMEEHWSSANFYRNLSKVKEIVCMKSEMQIRRFYFVGQS